MDEQRKKTLLIAGGGGIALAGFYLLSRRGGSPAAGSSDTSVYNALLSNVEKYVEEIATLIRGETQEAIEEATAETAETLRSERSGLLAALETTLETAVGTLTNQFNALTGRVSTLETETADLSRSLETETAALEKQLAQQYGALAGQLKTYQSKLSGVVYQQQAELMASDTRLQAAMAATLGKISQFGTSQVPGQAENIAASFGQVFELSPEQLTVLKSWARHRSNELARGQIATGGPGLSWLPPLMPGPMGFRARGDVGLIDERPPAWDPSRASQKWGLS